MTAHSSVELKAKLDDLRLRYEQKSAALMEKEAELEAVKKKASELRRCLQATGTKNTSLVPSEIRAGPGHDSNPETELQRILTWLAEHVVLEDAIVFNAGVDLIAADQHIQIRNIVQWRLVEDLRLSVPVELAPELSNLLSAVKTKGAVFASTKAKDIANSWSLLQCEDVTNTMLMLTHNESNSTCIVADFPVPSPPTPGQLQVWAGVSIGDHVEVKFEGQWFPGTVCCIKEDGLTYVHCDVDPPDIMTTAPMSMLRRPRGASSLPEESCKKEAST
jgi:hypothetical protein